MYKQKFDIVETFLVAVDNLFVWLLSCLCSYSGVTGDQIALLVPYVNIQ